MPASHDELRQFGSVGELRTLRQLQPVSDRYPASQPFSGKFCSFPQSPQWDQTPVAHSGNQLSSENSICVSPSLSHSPDCLTAAS